MKARAEPLVQALAAVPWLRASGDAAVECLADASHLQHLVDRQAVGSRGTQTSHLVVVASGTLELSMTNVQGKRHTTSLLGKGQVFGLIPLLDGSTLIHDACARGASSIVVVPRDAILSTMEAQPALAMQMLLLMCQRARHNYEVLAGLSLLPLHVRVVRLLLDRSSEQRIHLTQAALAEMLGASRQSVNLELKKLERSGAIAISRGDIEILDAGQLQAIAGS
ncbi:Crp/Fnr family transcriptional regulator [Variovorax sp. 54]|uniref:Crp/Fnr family transcriptional regulator n=1 Tax=Variovorax sp. 54 TaxID=2035212 RepID=UPI000C17C49A|nr:Crp/Fnr family transcriptional regulator [Variovorax sp. 54]PIF73100.1 Crp/Fnr family transcriptional regulator [Variovorax sp. 54]